MEFSLALPILLLLAFAIVQFGLMIATYMDLTSATRDAARFAVQARKDTDPEGGMHSAFNASADRVDESKVNFQVSGGWDADDTVSVTATLPYKYNVMGVVLWNGDLKASSVVRIG